MPLPSRHGRRVALRSLVGVVAIAAAVAGLAPAPRAAAATPFYAAPFERRPSASELTELGRALFADRSLSASGQLACASCHDPAHAYGPADARAVQLGGASMRSPGVRAVPSLRYQQNAPPFSEHYSDTDGDDSIDQGPTGGRGWDGRASSVHEQAALPLLSAYEMGNADRAAAVARLRRSAHAEAFRRTFGGRVLDDPELAWTGLLLALEVFQQSPTDFYPYSSKYDAFLRGQAALDAAEKRGLALFNDPRKGNCAQCHPSAIKRGAFPQFTDFGFIALAVPRNPAIPANADPAYRDLGLCGPLRTDFAKKPSYCGLFKTPTLRNVALRKTFFHNGRYHDLDDVLRFYALRDVDPARIYGRDAKGKVARDADLPAVYRGNVNQDPPFAAAGHRPVLSSAERADIVRFLATLTDGYRPAPAR